MRKNCKRRFINLQPKSMERQYRAIRRNFGKQLTELETKEKEINELTTELESKERENNSLRCSIDEKEKQIGEKVKEISECESKLNECHEVHMRDIEELQEKNDKLATELESKERENKSLRCSFDEKEKQIGEKVNYLESRNKHLLGRVEELESKEKRRLLEFELKETQLEDQVKKLELKATQFDDQVKGIQLKMEEYEGKQKQQVQYSNNQLSPTTPDGGNLQLLSDETELTINDCINFLEKENEDVVSKASESSSKVEAITKNQVQEQPKGKKHANEVEQSSHKIPTDGAVTMKQVKGRQPELRKCTTEAAIKTQVRQPQKKKRAIKSFEEEKVLKENSDCIQNLITRKQYIGAVRYICQYDLAEKFQPFILLREHIKQMSQLIHRKARDEEIVSLGVVLQCMLECKLKSQDLVDEIKDRINFLKKENEDVVSKASESCSKVEAITKKNQVQQQPKGKKRANEVEQPSHKIRSDAVRERQPEKRKCTTEAAIKTQVRQPREKKRAIEAVSGGHDLKPWGDKRPRTERVEVRPEEEEEKEEELRKRERERKGRER